MSWQLAVFFVTIFNPSGLCPPKGNRVPCPCVFGDHTTGGQCPKSTCCMKNQSYERLWPPLLKLKFGNGWLTSNCCSSSCKKNQFRFSIPIPIPIPIPGFSIPIPFSIPPISIPIPIPIPELELELSCNSNSGIELTPTLELTRNYTGTLTHCNPGQNGCNFPDDTFKCIFMNENFYILIKISLKFLPKGPIDNKPALV